MDIKKLFYFNCVAKYRNFSKAAEECHIAQAAMSRHIASLEDELGFELFYRSHHRVELTPAGKYFLEASRNIINTYRQAQAAGHEIAPDSRDCIAVGFGGYDVGLVKKYVTAFREAYPNCSILLYEYHYEDVVQNLLDQNCDVLFSPSLRLESVTNARKILLSQAEYTIVASQTNPLSKLDRIPCELLNGKTFICPTDKHRNWLQAQVFENLCESFGFQPGKVVYSNSTMAVLTMVELDLGITMLSDCFLWHHGYNVCNIPIVHDTGFKKQHMLACLEPCQKPIVKRFMDFAEALRNQPET